MKQYVLLVILGSQISAGVAHGQALAQATTRKKQASVAASQHQPSALAPPPADEPPRRLPVRFGVKVGVNYSNTNFNEGEPKPVVPVETTWKVGYSLGFLVEIALSQKFALQQEYLFSQMSGEIKNGARYRLQYLSLPLLLKYKLVPRLAVVAGPQVDFLINSHEEISGQTTDITHDTEERGIGATAGLEVQAWQNVSFSARYFQGLNHIGIGQRSAVQEFKFQSVQVAADIKF